MITLVTGASSSGKSLIAETIAVNQSSGNLYYIATMHTWDKEAELKVKRHQEMRADKGFITIEKYVDIGSIDVEADSTLLIECMSNLLANEMYDNNDSSAHTKIINDIKILKKSTGNIIIVTNEIFADGNIYDEWCTDYINKLGYINCELGKIADVVIESVVGIPIYQKGEKYDCI